MANYRKSYPAKKLYDAEGNCYQLVQILDPNLRDDATGSMIGTTYYRKNGETVTTEEYARRLSRDAARGKLIDFALANAPRGTTRFFYQRQ